jgi:hypothetical protein
MMRKLAIAFAGLCAVSLVLWTVNDASARSGHHRGGHHGGFSGKFGGGSSFRGGTAFRSGFAAPRFSGASRFGGGAAFHRHRFHHHHHHHHRRFGVRFAAPILFRAYHNPCLRWVRVWTPYGPQLQRVNVCGYRYARTYPYGW